MFKRTILSFSRESALFYNRPNYLVCYSAIQLLLQCSTAWENSQRFKTPPLLFPRNDVWETSAKIPYWWRDTTQIGWATRETCFNQSENTTQIWVVTRHQYGITALVPQTSFPVQTRGGVAKCRLFSQAVVVQRLITHVSAVSTSNFLRLNSFSRFYFRSDMYSITAGTDIIVYPPLLEWRNWRNNQNS